jgi:non-canonical (house-cleaning) NTP pyrophosphatase
MSENQIGRRRTATFFLPEKVAQLVRQGKELGEANDIGFNRSNSRLNDGAIRLLTCNVIDRARLYEHGVIMALVAFKNIELYKSQA